MKIKIFKAFISTMKYIESIRVLVRISDLWKEAMNMICDNCWVENFIVQTRLPLLSSLVEVLRLQFSIHFITEEALIGSCHC